MMITKKYRRLLIGISFITCHLSFSVALTSCADYNVTDDFKADPDPSYVEPYKDLNPVKSYIDRNQYPNLTLGATLKVAEYNKQELAHAAAMTNFDNLAFGSTLMSGSIVNGTEKPEYKDYQWGSNNGEPVQRDILRLAYDVKFSNNDIQVSTTDTLVVQTRESNKKEFFSPKYVK